MTRKLKVFRLNLRLILLFGTALLLLGVQIAALFPGITTPMERMEYAAHDLLFRLRGTRPPSRDIVIVAIDDFSFNWTGYQWPWPRSYLAGIVDQVNAGGGKVIGLDIFLFELDSHPDGDAALAKSLSQSPAAVSVIQIFKDSKQNISTIRKPLSIYRDVFDGIGITSFSLDEDLIIRSVEAYDNYLDKTYYHWALEIARLYLGSEPASKPDRSRLQFGNNIIPLRAGHMLVNFSGPAGTYPTYSAANVHDGVTLEENPNAFRDKIVLIGATTLTLQDFYPTPFSARIPTPGVEVVANAVDTIISGEFISEAPPWLSMIIIILAALVATFLTRSRHPTMIIISMLLIMAGYAVVGFLTFFYYRYIIPVVAPEIMLFLGVVVPTLEQTISQEIEKRRVRSLFTRFISPEMVDQLMSTRDINSLNKRANLSIIFSDIRGFTTLSEQLSPEEVVALLNPYLKAMTKVIHKHGGTVDKYEGDAIIAFFGEPVAYEDHAERAIRTAIDMRKALFQLGIRWEMEGRQVRNIDIGIGINSGEVFVGLLGSAQRINYTIIGDNVNLASRLQDLSKTYRWPVIISESTYQSVKDKYDAELVDAVVVKGKTKAVNVYKLLGKKGGADSERIQPWKYL